jgi:raffinose/stachyose/melibiose transport system substrate-binding protein
MKARLLRIFSIILVLVLTISLTACGDKPVSEESKTGGTSDSSSEGKDDKKEPITITFSHCWTKENATGQAKAFFKAIEKFRAEHPDIIIEEDVLAHDAYEIKIKTLASGNELPDIFSMKGSMMRAFAANGLLMPVEGILDTDPEWKNSFLDDVFDDFILDGTIYGVPYQMNVTHLIYYNTDLFKQAGINSFPKTWDEFLAAIDALKAIGVVPIALGNKAAWVAESCILSTLGDRFTGTEWFESIRDGKGAKFTDPEFIQALEAFQDLANRGAFNSDLNSIDNFQQQAMYMNGQAAMFMEGIWALPTLLDKAPQEIIDVTDLAILPGAPGGKGDPWALSGGAGWAYGISTKVSGEKLEAVTELVKAITDLEFAQYSLDESANPPNKTDGLDTSKPHPLFVKHLEIINTAKITPVYDVQLTPPVIEVMNSGLQELLIGMITPEELAGRIQREYESGS